MAHNEIMEKQDTIYPYKRTDVRAYNGNKGVTEVTIENPYESKIPTRFIVGMIDADSYIGNWGISNIMTFLEQLSTLTMKALLNLLTS